jgi:hypothetical protein
MAGDLHSPPDAVGLMNNAGVVQIWEERGLRLALERVMVLVCGR